MSVPTPIDPTPEDPAPVDPAPSARAAVARRLVPLVVAALPVAAALPGVAMAQDLSLPFEKFVLDNGLQVVVHEDHSDPLVAVIVVYHVGSSREDPGRSGFAHLFEHLMFQGSEHVGDDQHFKLISEAGGTLNGTTNRDRTNYFETLPSNRLELALWLEADRMGFLLPSVTVEKLDNQREVVKNEKRQRVDNQPYGREEELVGRALYPEGHPYSWQTIGSMEHLDAASLADVHGFFRRWYGPNNATLAIGGDVTPARARELAERWFGSIPRGPEVAAPRPRPAALAATVRLVEEDKVQLPQLTLVWPSAPSAHEDEAPLLMLASILSANKSSLLDRALTVEQTLASRIAAYQDGGELAGEFHVTTRPVPGVTLDELEQRIDGILERLDRDGVDAEQLARMQTRHEAGTINGLETVWRRTNVLAEANVFLGDPARATELMRQVAAVTPADVARVLRKYVVGRPSVRVSTVPAGRLDLAASGRTPGQAGAEAALDRARPPAPGAALDFRAPEVWHDTLPNGVAVVGTLHAEIPVTELTLSVPGGHLREDLATLGLSALTADLMAEGTAELSAVELTDALDRLGASLSVSSGDDDITLSLRVLDKHLPGAVALLGDVLLRPRLDPADFARLRTQALAGIETRGDRPATIAANAWRRLLHGDAGPQGRPPVGTAETLARLTVEDARAFWEAHAVPRGSRLTVVGDLDAPRLRDLFAPIVEAWPARSAPPPSWTAPPERGRTTVYLVDKPGAAQSEIRIGHMGVAATDPDHYPLTIMNHVLGGAFTSRINMNLREDKGYTYGARSQFSGDARPGPFTASSAVRTDVTKESVAELMAELTGVLQGLTEEETAFARDSLAQAMSRRYESIRARSGLLDDIARHGWPDDYPRRRMELLATIGRERLDGLAREHLHPDRMAILVVGDAAAVRGGLEELGHGPVVALDIDGVPLDAPAATGDAEM